MLIVPDNEALIVEVRVDPSDINQVHVGQPVVLRFPGLGARTTPDIDGSVSVISADLSQDDKTGTSFYSIRIALSKEQIARLGSVKLVPGMPVESFIETQPRTVLSFLVKPLQDQIERAFRER
jgi:HlyD family secretion protein